MFVVLFFGGSLMGWYVVIQDPDGLVVRCEGFRQGLPTIQLSRLASTLKP
jgi:hypothetical protein